MSFCFIILAGGRSKRFKSKLTKPYQKIGGKSLLEININKALKFKEIKKIIVVYNKKDTKRVKKVKIWQIVKRGTRGKKNRGKRASRPLRLRQNAW